MNICSTQYLYVQVSFSSHRYTLLSDLRLHPEPENGFPRCLYSIYPCRSSSSIFMSNLPQWRIRLVVALPILLTKLHLVYGASVLWRAVSYRARVVYMAALPILITKPQLVYGASVLWRAVSYRARAVYIGKLEISSSTLSSLAQSSGRCKTHKFERKGWQVIERHAALSTRSRKTG